MDPWRLSRSSDLGVQIATAAVIVLLATGVFNASIGQPVAFIVAFVLMAAAASTLGLLVAAVSFTSKAASTVGGVLFFVLLFFSGLWLPRAEMPGPLRGVSDALPVGAGVQAIQDAAAGRWASGLYFGVLAGLGDRVRRAGGPPVPLGMTGFDAGYNRREARHAHGDPQWQPEDA